MLSFLTNNHKELLTATLVMLVSTTSKAESFYAGGSPLSSSNDFKLAIGEKTTEFLSGDLQYIDFGTLLHQNDTVDAQSLGYALLFKKSITPKIQGFLKLGVHYWEIDVETPTNTYATSGTDGFIGVGLNVHIRKNWFVRAEYERFKFELEPSGYLKVNLPSLTLINKF